MPTLTSDLQIFPDPEQLCRAAAAAIAQMIGPHRGNRFRLVLSGGRTPETLYRILATEYAREIPWCSVELFWGDERYLPHDHPASNAGMVQRALLDHINIPATQVYPIPTGANNPASDAAAYQKTLQRCAETQAEGGALRFDLLLLGMGEDGHTASLFPGGDWLAEQEAWAVASRAPVVPHDRITLTFPILNAARHTMILVTGQKKQPILQEMFANSTAAASRYPIAMIAPQGEVQWLVDSAAWSGDAPR
ncbi:MAG: 6-phosphogluconolactonase [Armatimonadetes bacterium]|nr:6-phosphogluconolactonase [Armatimonadota bacterium]